MEGFTLFRLQSICGCNIDRLVLFRKVTKIKHIKSRIIKRSLFQQLNVNLLLVKGVVSEGARTVCEAAGVVIISSVPYKVLEQISLAADVDMLIYIALATEVFRL